MNIIDQVPQKSLSVPEQSLKVEGPFKKLDGSLLELIAYNTASPFSTLSQLNKYTHEIFSGPELLKRLLEQRFPEFPKFTSRDLEVGSRLAQEIRSILKEFRYKNSSNIFYVIWSEFLRKGKYPNLARIMFYFPQDVLNDNEKQQFENHILRKYVEMSSFDDIYKMDIKNIDDNYTISEFDHNKYTIYLLQNPNRKSLFNFNKISDSNLHEMIFHGLILDAPIEYFAPFLRCNDKSFLFRVMKILLMNLAMVPSIDPSIYNKLRLILDSMPYNTSISYWKSFFILNLNALIISDHCVKILPFQNFKLLVSLNLWH